MPSRRNKLTITLTAAANLVRAFVVSIARLQFFAVHHPNRKLQIFYQDETRFGQQGSLTRVWAPQGSRPTAVRQTQHSYVYVIGAACPETGQAEAIIAPYLDTQIINQFLEQFSRALPTDVQAVLVWDGAGYHCSTQLVVPD